MRKFTVTHGIAMCHTWRSRTARTVYEPDFVHLNEAREQLGKSAAEPSAKGPANPTRDSESS
jgi:hypothetical protein